MEITALGPLDSLMAGYMGRGIQIRYKRQKKVMQPFGLLV